MARKISAATLRKRLDAAKAKAAEIEADLKKAEEEEAIQIVGNIESAFAILGVFKASFAYLRNNFRAALPDDLLNYNFAKFPREKKLGDDAKLSETQTHNAIERGKRSILEL